MKSGIYLAFDVGGTSIKAGAFDSAGTILEHTLTQYEAKANRSAGEIFVHFAEIAANLLRKADPGGEKSIAGIGYAFPGPFDYEQGISYIQGLDKYEALYGMHVGEHIRNQWRSHELLASKVNVETSLRFGNDAALFSLGEAHYGAATHSQRAICFTIGTGIGSGFIEDGQIIRQRDDVPANGWVYHLPFRTGITDDYISRRGLLTLAQEMGISVHNRDVKEIAAAAEQGDEGLILLFHEFGIRMAEALERTLLTFRPDIVVLGGQIAKSGHLFVPSLSCELLRRGIQVEVALSENTLKSTLCGIYRMLQENNT